MKVYIVMDAWDCEAHKAIAVFECKEAAERIVEQKPDDYYVEEWTIGNRDGWITREAWQATIYLSNGRIAENYTNQSVYQELAPKNYAVRSIRHDPGGWVTVESYHSQKHALRVARLVRKLILDRQKNDPKYVRPDYFALEGTQ